VVAPAHMVCGRRLVFTNLPALVCIRSQVAAAIAKVPFVDLYNTMMDPSLPLTEHEYDEWGDMSGELDLLRDFPHGNFPQFLNFPHGQKLLVILIDCSTQGAFLARARLYGMQKRARLFTDLSPFGACTQTQRFADILWPTPRMKTSRSSGTPQ